MPSKFRTFYGWRVAGGAFVLAVFGLGMGFHGPPSICMPCMTGTAGRSP
jgi:hypothetical protein